MAMVEGNTTVGGLTDPADISQAESVRDSYCAGELSRSEAENMLKQIGPKADAGLGGGRVINIRYWMTCPDKGLVDPPQDEEPEWETPEGDFVPPIGPPVADGDFDGDGIPDEYDPDHYVIPEDETDSPVFGIDPSGEGDVVQVIADPQFDYIYTEIPTPNFLTEPSPFADFTTSGDVDLRKSGVLIAQSDEGTTSNVYIKIREGTRVTFAVRLDYQNKAIDRATIFPNDWAEEFDLVMEGGDELRWNVPKQSERGIPPWYSIDNPVPGTFSLLIDGQERIDQTSPIQTYHETDGGAWPIRARGEMTLRLEILKYEVGEEIDPVYDPDDDPQDEEPPYDGGGQASDEPVADPDDLFATSDLLLGIGVMILLVVYVISRLEINPNLGSVPNPAVA